MDRMRTVQLIRQTTYPSFRCLVSSLSRKLQLRPTWPCCPFFIEICPPLFLEYSPDFVTSSKDLMKVVSKSPRIVNGDPAGPGSECCPHECGPLKLEGPARPVTAEAVAQGQLAAPSTYIATHTARPSFCHTPARASPSTFKAVSRRRRSQGGSGSSIRRGRE